jgi:hypothetical protein
VDEARRVIQRLERIETLQSARAPAADLLAEVKQLLREGEAWLAAEHDGARATGDGGAAREATSEAESVLRGCRAVLVGREGVVPEGAESAVL